MSSFGLKGCEGEGRWERSTCKDHSLFSYGEKQASLATKPPLVSSWYSLLYRPRVSWRTRWASMSLYGQQGQERTGDKAWRSCVKNLLLCSCSHFVGNLMLYCWLPRNPYTSRFPTRTRVFLSDFYFGSSSNSLKFCT